MASCKSNHNLLPLLLLCSQPVLLGITCARTFILRRCDVEAVAQGELDATRVVVLHLAEHHAVAVEREAVDGPVEEVVACQLHVQTTLEEVFADAEREHRIGTVEPDVLLVAVGVHAEISLQEPVVGECDDVA